MWRLLIILVFSVNFLFSCGSNFENDTESAYSGFEVIIDTIQVDPGNDLLMAGAEIRNPGISKDKNWLYSWDQKKYALEIINLNSYKLEKKIYFEQDGPNSIGPNYFYRVDAFPNQLFGFEDYESYRVFNLKSELQRQLKFNAEWITSVLKETERFDLYSVNDSGTVLAGMHFDFTNFEPILFLIDWEKEQLNKLLLPEFDKLKNYKILLRMGGKNMASYSQDAFIQFQADSIIISNNVFNVVYFYNTSNNELLHKNYKYRLIPNGKQKVYKNETASEEEFNEIVKEMKGEVEFTQFYWDEPKEKYYRFASEVINIEEEEPRRKLYMAVYDKYLKLIGEKEIMTFKSEVTPLFIKEGKVHFYLNMEDELGFIRISLAEK